MRTTSLALAAALAAASPVAAAGSAADGAAPGPADSFCAAIVDGKKLLRRGSELGNESLLLDARAKFLAAHEVDPRSALALYHAASAEYVLIHVAAPAAGSNAAERFLGTAIAHAEAALALDDSLADAHALLASLYGEKMAGNFMLGPTLGPKADAHLARALEVGGESPRVWIAQGLAHFFAPAMFGGDEREAIRDFERAVKFAEVEAEGGTGDLAPDWGRVEAYAWLGQAHAKAGDEAAAARAYRRALALAPDCAWVKQDLLPAVEPKAEVEGGAGG